MAADIGIRTKLKATFEQAIQRTTEALKTEGFGVLTQIDMQGTLKQKINVDFQRYVILGACNPALAHRALSANSDAGLLLPCNVTLEEAGPEIIITAVDPIQMLGVLGEDPTLRKVASQAKQKLQSVITSIE
jgi:uncharacterized protein (DUF302 family)